MSDAWDWGRERKWDTVVRFASFISAAAEVGMHFLHARSTTRSIPCSYGHSLIYIGWLHMNECQLNNSFSTTCQMIIWTINNWAKKNELFSIEQLPRQSSTAFHVQGCQNSQLFHFYIFPKILLRGRSLTCLLQPQKEKCLIASATLAISHKWKTTIWPKGWAGLQVGKVY